MITANFDYKAFNFPGGERHIVISEQALSEERFDLEITWEYQNDAEIFELALIVKALESHGQNVRLYIPYFPYSRQDRVTQNGEAFSLKVICDIINGFVNVEYVMIDDPHSDVTTALLDNVTVNEQQYIAEHEIGHKENFWLVSPDGGALKKIYKLVPLVSNQCLGVIECSKLRNVKTGEITKTLVHSSCDLLGQECVIVDDICDGGRTFTEIAKVLKEKNAGKISLYVTHGFFTKGLSVFDGLIDEIYTRKGKIK